MSTITSRTESQRAARDAEKVSDDLQQQDKAARQQTERDRLRAQQLLMRSLRAGSGGIFASDSPTNTGTVL